MKHHMKQNETSHVYETREPGRNWNIREEHGI